MSETGPMRAGQRIANVIAAEFKDWVAAGCPAVEEPDGWSDWRASVDWIMGNPHWAEDYDTKRVLRILADRIERLEQGL